MAVGFQQSKQKIYKFRHPEAEHKSEEALKIPIFSQLLSPARPNLRTSEASERDARTTSKPALDFFAASDASVTNRKHRLFLRFSTSSALVSSRMDVLWEGNI